MQRVLEVISDLVECVGQSGPLFFLYNLEDFKGIIIVNLRFLEG